MSNKTHSVIVHAFPGTKKEKFEDLGGGAFNAYVREPAQHNLANTRVRELVARFFTVAPSSVIITTGHRARKKSITVTVSK